MASKSEDSNGSQASGAALGSMPFADGEDSDLVEHEEDVKHEEDVEHEDVSGSSNSNSNSSDDSGTSSESFADDSQDLPDREVMLPERKRKGFNVAVANLAEQSVLKDGYLLPAVEGSEVSDTEQEATKPDDGPAPTQTETSKRRLGIMLTPVGRLEPEQQAPEGQAQRDNVKKDPAAAFPLFWEEDDDFPVFMVQTSLDPVQLEKAVLHYRSLPPSQFRQYHCLVNLACCLMSLNQARHARSHLEQAAVSLPNRASAQLNLIACCLRIRDRAAALQALHQALRNAEDLQADDHRLLLRTRKELTAKIEKSGSRKAGAGQSKDASKQVRRRPAARYQVITRLEAWQMRKELLALRSTDATEEVKPPWRRRHVYSQDSEQAIYSKKARWQPLSPEAFASLRQAFAEMAERQEVSAFGAQSDEEEDSDSDESSDDSEEEDGTDASERCKAARAYAAIKALPCMKALAKESAIAVLQAGELVDYERDSQIFEQGDPALHVYIVVRGSVSIRVLIPGLGQDRIPVETLYDGQIFGDAKVASWNDAEAPPQRKAGARAQEATCLLRIPAAAYRQALGLDRKRPIRKSSFGEADEEGAALLPDVRRKVHAMARSPLFAGATTNNLVLLASNLQEVSLRYDDVFVEIDQALQACFLISAGYLRVAVPGVDMEARLPERSGEASRPGSATGAIGSTSSEIKTAKLPSRFSLNKNSVELPVFQLGERPLLLPPRSTSSVVSARSTRLTPRKPGTPRRGTPWQHCLRQTRVAPFTGAAEGDIELCHLHAGEAFGLAALYDPKGECPYLSSGEVRVQSSEAKILVLTPGSLVYLSETVSRSLVEKAKKQEDPIAPSLQSIKRERLNRSKWIVRKHKVLHRVVMRED
ncbi:unnamed protein product [Effrenium voratum]|uniref:Cyclic nucleotide-binding domain-containing protein n=1 Tax=Effrenium voratum TaxID=2562239 RepID=A0AA36MWV2_9DINO|nr:unnamed protein product [Effrenium voratum]